MSRNCTKTHTVTILHCLFYSNSVIEKNLLIILLLLSYHHLRVLGSRLVLITLRTLTSEFEFWWPLLPCDPATRNPPPFPLLLLTLLLLRNFNLGSREASTLAGTLLTGAGASCLLKGWNLCCAELCPWRLLEGAIDAECSKLWFWFLGRTDDDDTLDKLSALGEFLPCSPCWRLWKSQQSYASCPMHLQRQGFVVKKKTNIKQVITDDAKQLNTLYYTDWTFLFCPSLFMVCVLKYPWVCDFFQQNRNQYYTCLYCWRNSALGSLIFGNSQNTIQKLEKKKL